MLLRKLVFVAAICLLTAACSTPYGIPRLDDGVNANAPVTRFDGIADLAAMRDTRVLWIHGMCTHEDEWVLKRHNALARAIDMARAAPDARFTRAGPRNIPFENVVNGHRFQENYLVWSPLTADIKNGLKLDNLESEGGKFPHERAELNDDLKADLINDCLVDAVIYSGANGDPIRDWVKQEVCISLGGRYSGRRCTFPSSAEPVTTVLVAESLGSKLLFDAIREIWDETPRAARSSLEAQLASVQTVFLIANQIPLLDAADRPPIARFDGATSPSLDDVAGILAKARDDRGDVVSRIGGRDLHVVSFTDPNDLLSYRLTPEALRRNDTRITNVIVSNAPTYFGYLERPDHAHCGYDWNPYVIGTVVSGYDGGRANAIELDLPKECSLAGAPSGAM